MNFHHFGQPIIFSQPGKKENNMKQLQKLPIGIQAPMSSERFTAGVVFAMQKERLFGVTRRYMIVLKQF